jgi:hypothetical protein
VNPMVATLSNRNSPWLAMVPPSLAGLSALNRIWAQ